MRFVSTGDEAAAVDLSTALLRGLAPDGGLYLPERLPELPEHFFAALTPGMAELGADLLAPFLGDVPDAEARRLVADAFDFDVPLVELEEGVYLLELFHGPTLAFKDVAARFLARFMGHFAAEMTREDRPLTVLVATSGDTGGAVAQAFHGVAGTRVVVLYPRGRVSKLQEKQFTTLGGNVRALAVDGAFDDCQRLVKAAFADRELQDALFMTSANSINIGRLLPQMVYYVHAVAQLPAGAGAPVFVVPSGNFGNLTAGLLVHELGLPVERFVAATNANDVVPEYLDTGLYRPRPSVATLSNAMDVGAPSNFARILALYDGDPEAIRRKIHGSHHDDEETRRAIRDVHDRLGVVLDPHTAVGYLGLWEAREREGLTGPGIVLATAHPAKFRDDVEPILGREIDIPKRLARCLGRPSEAREIAAELAELKAFLLAWDA